LPSGGRHKIVALMVGSLLVFDLDGTLADTAPDLLATLEAVLPRHGIPVAIDAGYRDGIGLGARHLIEYALRRQSVVVGKPTLDAVYRDFLIHYEANICVGTRLFPGTIALLDRFAEAGWSFAVCTNKPEGMSRLLLEKLGVADRFVAIGGGDSFPLRKPDPAHLLMTITAASGWPERSVMVGDSRTDVDTARGANIPIVGVTFGYTPEPMAVLAPDLLIDAFDELKPRHAAGLLATSLPDAKAMKVASAGAP
jgi:phosphoglycolate phosphatase